MPDERNFFKQLFDSIVSLQIHLKVDIRHNSRIIRLSQNNNFDSHPASSSSKSSIRINFRILSVFWTKKDPEILTDNVRNLIVVDDSEDDDVE